MQWTGPAQLILWGTCEFGGDRRPLLSGAEGISGIYRSDRDGRDSDSCPRLSALGCAVSCTRCAGKIPQDLAVFASPR